MLREIQPKSSGIWTRSSLPKTNLNPSLVCFNLHGFSTCACSRQQSHYTTLGLKQNATASQIKSKFYELSKTHHPDMNPSCSDSADRFKQISEAYTVLSDLNLRQKYDQTISNGYSSHSAGTYADMSAGASAGNAARRQSANYAWSTRRRVNLKSGLNGVRDPFSDRKPTEDFSATLNRFERLARRKKATAGTSSSWNSTNSWRDPNQRPASDSKSDLPKVSAAKQTIQLAFMLTFIFWIGSKLHL